LYLGLEIDRSSSNGGGDVHDGDGVENILNFLAFWGRNVSLLCSRTGCWEVYFELGGKN